MLAFNPAEGELDGRRAESSEQGKRHLRHADRAAKRTGTGQQKWLPYNTLKWRSPRSETLQKGAWNAGRQRERARRLDTGLFWGQCLIKTAKLAFKPADGLLDGRRAESSV